MVTQLWILVPLSGKSKFSSPVGCKTLACSIILSAGSQNVEECSTQIMFKDFFLKDNEILFNVDKATMRGKPLAWSEPDPLASSIVLSPTDRPHLLISAVKQLLAMDFNAAGHLCSAFLLVYSERHQQNRANGNTLQVREGKMRLQGGGGEDLSPRLITPLMACQVLTQQRSRPLPSSCPSTPPPTR